MKTTKLVILHHIQIN